MKTPRCREPCFAVITPNVLPFRKHPLWLDMNYRVLGQRKNQAGTFQTPQTASFLDAPPRWKIPKSLNRLDVQIRSDLLCFRKSTTRNSSSLENQVAGLWAPPSGWLSGTIPSAGLIWGEPKFELAGMVLPSPGSMRLRLSACSARGLRVKQSNQSSVFLT